MEYELSHQIRTRRPMSFADYLSGPIYSIYAWANSSEGRVRRMGEEPSSCLGIELSRGCFELPKSASEAK